MKTATLSVVIFRVTQWRPSHTQTTLKLVFLQYAQTFAEFHLKYMQKIVLKFIYLLFIHLLRTYPFLINFCVEFGGIQALSALTGFPGPYACIPFILILITVEKTLSLGPVWIVHMGIQCKLTVNKYLLI